jgi:hypothetical protein
MYTTQQTVEAFLNRELTDNEAVLFPLVVGFVHPSIVDAMGGEYGIDTVSSKVYDGGFESIAIDRVYDVDSVELLNSEGNVTRTYVLGQEVVLRPSNASVKSWVDRRTTKFPRGKNVVRVTGKFGLGTDIPNDIIFLETYMVSKLYSSSVTGDLEAESIEGYSRKFAKIDWANDSVYMLYWNALVDTEILI